MKQETADCTKVYVSKVETGLAAHSSPSQKCHIFIRLYNGMHEKYVSDHECLMEFVAMTGISNAIGDWGRFESFVFEILFTHGKVFL